VEPAIVVPDEVDADLEGKSDYVKAKGGKRPIRKILIANNGMAATKSILSMRQWAYMELGDEKLIDMNLDISAWRVVDDAAATKSEG
jgi:hypothetical protein